jgi:N-acetyl-anhydromuramyl-L-alanine amidase AmpD
MTPSTPILYPGAIWQPLTNHSDPGTLAQRKLIVLHDTEGTTAAGAINTFRTSVHPNRTSVHLVVDRDGTVYQLVDLADTAWHASAVNSHSIGIEHVGLSAAGAQRLNSEYADRIAAGTQKPWNEMLATKQQ